LDSGTTHVNGKAYPTKRGMLLCAKPGSIRYSDFPVRCSFIRVFRTKGKTEDIEAILSMLPDCMYIDDMQVLEELLSLFTRLSSYLISSSLDTHELIKANSTFLEILSIYLKLYRKPDNTHMGTPMYRPVREIHEYINEHFASDCSLKKLASIVNLSPNHLHVIFKESVGLTPYEYVLTKRVELAKKLIITGEKSMLDIALVTGFCSQSHFNKVFKKQTGTTPAQFKKQIWDRY
jgi:AraC family transcriptional regulator